MDSKRPQNSDGSVLMYHKHTSPRVFLPHTINEALEMAVRESNAVFLAGGTELSCHSMDRKLINLPKTVISLSLVEELKRASRSEYGLDIGAMMTLESLLQISRSTLPTGLYDAISCIGTLPLRNRATIGGHLALQRRIGNLHPLLQLLDTRIEIRSSRRRGRKHGLVRKIPIALLDKKTLQNSKELISKISIPVDNWDIGFHRKILPGNDDERFLIFTALASVKEGVLSEWRMSFSDGYTEILRDRELEVDMAGQSLPFGNKELKILEEGIFKLTAPWKADFYNRKTAVACARGFLKRIENNNIDGTRSDFREKK